MVARTRKDPERPADPGRPSSDEPSAGERRGVTTRPAASMPAAPGSFAGRLFLTWRLALSRLMLPPARTAREAIGRARPVETLSSAGEAVRRPEGIAGLSPGGRLRLRLLGVVAVIVGAAALVYVGGPLGLSLDRRLIDAAWLLAWAPARLAIMRLTRAGDGRAITDAWGIGLLPLALAVAFPLDIAALAGSAWLTYRALGALGDEPAASRDRVLFAFGGQAAAMIAAWLLTRGGLVFLLGGTG